MSHAFDCGELGSLLDDARQLSSLSSQCPEQTEVAEVANRIVRRLIGSVDATEPNRPVVLIVDDSRDSREATSLLLEQAGFHVITAANGLEALIVAHCVKPVVVLLDLMMPVLDGLQTARLLSESQCTWRVNVIAYSGRADMFSRRLPGTFSAILAKPTTPEELVALVHTHATAAEL